MSTKRNAGRTRSVYEFIKAHRDEHSVQTTCRILGVAPSGYYKWLPFCPNNGRAILRGTIVVAENPAESLTASNRPRGRLRRRCGHAYHKRPDARLQRGAAPMGAAIRPLPRDQFPVPAKNGVGRDERCDLAQQPAPQAVAEFCEAPTLVIVETQPPSLKTDLQHTILFAEKRDRVFVFTLSPRAEHRQHELERRHGGKFTSEMVDR